MAEPLLGPASLVEGLADHWWQPRPLEAVVLSGSRLDHYRRLTDRPDRTWQRIATITDAATGVGELRLAGRRLLARVPQVQGPAVFVVTGTGWQPADLEWPTVPPAEAALPTAAELGAGAGLLRAVAPARSRGRPVALTDEAGSVYGYQCLPEGRWVRTSCLRLADDEPFDATGPESVKLAQVTGERDATPTPWGERAATLSRSLSTAGIRGTDLGVRFEHDGRSFLLFGDTHWHARPWLATRDALAELTATGPLPGLPGVRFHGSPLRLDHGSMREYDVPLDGFSHAGACYVLFTTDHFRDRQVMGRSVLARAVDPALPLDPGRRHQPVRFQVLATLSRRHFVNASIQLRPADEVPGCDGPGQVLLIWGTGSYRASEVRLALLDTAGLDRLARSHGPRADEGLGLRYWRGDGWSTDEDEAVPLWRPGAVGELSVRWSQAAGRYLALTASGPEDPVGHAIVLRTAATPWGPWSRRIRLLDWVATGMAVDPHTRFIKSRLDQDPVGERVFAAQANGTGAAYAPYYFSSERDGDDLVLRYTLSTWNPYQVVLLQHRLPLDALP